MIKEVKYLDSFIFETLRLKPALKVGGSRQTPASGITIDEVYIPGGVDVVVPMEMIQRDPRYWQQADEFVPERWDERRQDMATDQSPYMPFSLGRYSILYAVYLGPELTHTLLNPRPLLVSGKESCISHSQNVPCGNSLDF